MSNYIGFDKGDEDLLGDDVESYRGTGGETDRLSLCWFYQDDDGNYKRGEDDTPKFKTVKYHYLEGKGYVKHCDYLEKKLGQPKKRVGTFVVQYKTDKNGQLDQNNFGYKVQPWEFGKDKFRSLKQKHLNFPLTCYDFTVFCKGEQYQKLEFSSTPDKAKWQQSEEVVEDVLNKVERLEDSLSLARTLPEQELREHFNDTPEPDVESDSAEEFDDFMNDVDIDVS